MRNGKVRNKPGIPGFFVAAPDITPGTLGQTTADNIKDAPMFHPNRRYGHAHVLRALTAGMPIDAISRRLRRHPRTIHDWLTDRRPVPWWATEIIDLQNQIAWYELRYMGIRSTPRNVINMGSTSRRTSDRDASSTRPPAATTDQEANSSTSPTRASR